jgi:hypothetical protein
MEDIEIRQRDSSRLVNIGAIALLVLGMTGPLHPYIFCPLLLPDKWGVLLASDGYPFLFAGTLIMRRPAEQKLMIAAGLIICYSALWFLVLLLVLTWHVIV